MRSRDISAFAVVLLPVAAQAHDASIRLLRNTEGFMDGFFHPITGLDHLAMMIAIGLWCSLTASRVRDLWLTPIVFVVMLFVGALAGIAGISTSLTEPTIAFLLLMIGLFVACRIHLPQTATIAFVGLSAFFHGMAHGTELPTSTNSMLWLTGMMSATVVLHVIGISLGRFHFKLLAWPSRVTGTALVGFGVMLLLPRI